MTLSKYHCSDFPGLALLALSTNRSATSLSRRFNSLLCEVPQSASLRLGYFTDWDREDTEEEISEREFESFCADYQPDVYDPETHEKILY